MSEPPSYTAAIGYQPVTKQPTVAIQPLAQQNTCHLPDCPHCKCPSCKTNNLVLESETDWCVYQCGSPLCCDPYTVTKRCKHCGYQQNAQEPPESSNEPIEPLQNENTCHLPGCPYCQCPNCGANNLARETETDWCVVCCGNPYCCDPYTVMKRCSRCGYQQDVQQESL